MIRIMTQKPETKPNNPCFSSGPCAKRPGWSVDQLNAYLAGRSHRSGIAKKELESIIETQRDLLGIPDDYRIGIMPASDTGAFEMALWNMIGARGVDVMAWESFSGDWLYDIVHEIKPDDVRTFDYDYGETPDLSAVDSKTRDIVFAWNGTTSGVRVPDGDWIDENREGLTFCDATSAVFAYDLPWDKLDVTTWSWQKVLGSEAAHGMLVLSPRAVERLESYTPDRPLPKIFRLMKKGKLNEGVFKGETLNTPSMLAVADCRDALNWVKEIGGPGAMKARCRKSLHNIANWVNNSDWAEFLCADEAYRSYTSVCITVKDPWFQEQPLAYQTAIIKNACDLLEKESAAYDVKHYKTAPPGFRIWCGATVEPDDVAAVLPWLDWAYESVKADESVKEG